MVACTWENCGQEGPFRCALLAIEVLNNMEGENRNYRLDYACASHATCMGRSGYYLKRHTSGDGGLLRPPADTRRRRGA